jgi:beta-glucanase (GH16 family)
MKKITLVPLVLCLISVHFTQLSAQSQRIKRGTKTDTVQLDGRSLCPSEPWQLVFADEFEGTQLDTSKWFTYFPYGTNSSDSCGFCRLHGLKTQVFTDNNVVVKNGLCELLSRREKSTWFGTDCNYTSGVIYSKQNFTTYGKYEIRCKIPAGQGFIPAFWIFGWSTEIDIFEFGGQRPKRPCFSVHKWQGGDAPGQTGWTYHYDEKDFSTDFHVFAVEYEPNFVKFLIDGAVVWQLNRFYKTRRRAMNTCEAPAGEYLQHPAFPRFGDPVQVIANNAIGKDGGPFTNAPNAQTILPNKMEVDYIRVYQRQPQADLSPLIPKR